MASVAVAIEQAAGPKHVDETLWWDSYVSLFNDLENLCSKGGLNSEAVNSILQKLKKHHGWLLNSVAFFKLPNSSSRLAINCTKIIVGEHKLDIKPELRDMALELSSHLVLDEVQTYILLSRFVEENDPNGVNEIKSLAQTIIMRYYLERQCLLKCTRQILTYKLSAENDFLHHEFIREELEQLLNDGLEDKVFAVLKQLLSAERPPSLDIQFTELWSEETLIEENLVLDILFLLYYEPFCICKADRWENIFATFKGIISGSSNIEKLAVTKEAGKYAQHVKHQFILLLIEGLDLDDLLLMVYGDTSFSKGFHAFSLEELQEIDSLMSGLNSLDIPESGPLIFAWASFTCLLSFLPTENESTILAIDHLVYIRQAYESGVPNFILQMLRSETFQDFDVQDGGYKGVLKTLLAAFIAAYDITTQMEDSMVKILLDILCEIYCGQESLCLEFWDRESVIDGPIRSLLFTLRDYFPYKSLDLTRLLSSLCEGAWPAECVYQFLYKMFKVTSLYQSPGYSYVNDGSQIVKAHTSLQVPGASGLFIPCGTIGHVLKVVDKDVILVRWECMHSGILVLLFRMMQEFSSEQQYEELVASLELLSRILSFNKALVLTFLELDVSSAVKTARFEGHMEKTMRIDVIKIICSLINNLVPICKESKILALCISVLCKFSDCSTIRVVTEIFRTLLFQSPTNISSSDMWLLPEGLARLLLLDGEQSGGCYPLTISVLDLSKQFLAKGVQTELIITLVMYFVRYLLVNHGNWKYKFRHERWEIMSKVFQLIHIGISSKMDQHPSQLRRILMETLLYDTTIHDVLLQVLCIRAESLEELYTNRLLSVKEIEWLHQAINSALNLVEYVFLDAIAGDSLKDYLGMSSLDQALLRTTVVPTPFVIAAASLLTFFRNAALQLGAARVLSRLCVIAQKARPHSVSIASYFLSPKQRRDLRSVICHLLCEETAASNSELFSAIVDLITSAALYQPSFVELMLFPESAVESSTLTGNNNITELATSSSAGDGIKLKETTVDNGVDVFWRFLQTCEKLMKSHPLILSQILHFLKKLWQGGTEYIHILEKLHSRDMFWKYISSCILLFSSYDVSPLSKMNDDEILDKAYQYQCQSSALEIMAHDIFLRRHLVQIERIDTKSPPPPSTPLANNSDKSAKENDNRAMLVKYAGQSGAEKILAEWGEDSAMCKILRSYASSLYDKDLMFRAKAVGRACVVGLIGKVLVGDNTGLSVSSVEQIQLASQKIFEHPAFLELLGQYSTRGYSHGKELHALIINDLYYHLQGELEGRHIPPGPFQQVSEFLIKLQIDTILQANRHIKSRELHSFYDDKCIYDIEALKAHLGIEWWPQSDDKAFTSSAEKALQSMSHANRAFYLAESQHNALKAWMSVLTLALFDKNIRMEPGPITLHAAFSETSLELCIEDLCKLLQASVQLLGPLGDATKYMPNFVATQTQILFILVRRMYGHVISRISGMQSWPLCARVIRTVIASLRSLMDIKTFLPDGLETIVRCLLGILLMSLDFIHYQNKEQHIMEKSETDMQNVGDAFADVSLMGAGFLPILCSCVENKDYANLALAVINVLLTGFLAPNTWLPILQKHFPTQLMICGIQRDTWHDSASIILNFCLSLAHVKGGAEMLQSAGFFSCLSTFNHFVREEISSGSGVIEGPFSVWHKGRVCDGLWGLGLAVVTAMVKSVGENDTGVSLVDNALTFFLSEKDYILRAVQAPELPTDALIRKRMRNQKPQTSLTALQETEHAITLMCQLAQNQITWLNVMQGVDSELRETTIHLLAFITRGGLLRPDEISSKGVFLRCPPLLKEEKAMHEKPSVINSNRGWFAVSARGCMPKNRWVTPHQIAPDCSTTIASLSLVNSRAESDIVVASCTQYSDSVAIQLYKIAFLVLKFLCKQAQAAVKRIEEAGNIDLVHFPELPVPEILHGLQDQATAIVTELCSSRKGKPVEPQVQSVCLLLLRIMEKALYLEVCVIRICGICPVSVRVDDFSKQYKELVSAAYDQIFLEPLLKSLKRVLILAYPTLA